MRASRKVPLAGMALAALVATAACSGGGGGSSSGDGEPVDGKAFAMAVAVDPGNLDPSRSISSSARSIFGFTYDTLVYAKADGTIVGGLAEKWDATESAVTFTLKDGITCSDGTPLAAQDVADNVNYITDPKNGSELLGVIVQAGVTATADDAAKTVTVTSDKPNGLLVSELTGMYVLCRAGLDDHDAVAKKAIGTGPYTLEEAVSGDRYVFKPRKEYTWGPDGQTMDDKGVPTEAVVRIIDSQTTIANLLRSGELNLSAVGGTDAERLPDDIESLDAISPAGMVWFNENEGHPGADPAVREALVAGVDRKALADVSSGKTGGPAKNIVTLPPSPCLGEDNVGPNMPDFDQDEAKKVLDDAGWVEGSDGVRAKGDERLAINLTYTSNGQATRDAGMELLVTQWEELGAEVKLVNQPDAQLTEDLFSTGSWDATATPFTFSLPSQVIGFVSGPASPEGSNFANMKNAEYTAAVEEATPLVGEESCGAWNRAEAALIKANNPTVFFEQPTKIFYQGSTLTAPGGEIWGSTVRMVD
jgi:peptide/nickel transport system substrate-binding protein